MSSRDFQGRLVQWQESLSLMRRDPLHVSAGMGLGSFPREFYLGQVGPMKLASYRLERDSSPGQRSYLALNGGRAMYLDQRIDATAGREVQLRGQLRASRQGARLAIGLCEKSLLASVGCAWAEVEAGVDWQTFEVQLTVPPSARAAAGIEVPVSLSLHNATFGARVDVTQLSVLDGQRELLANGSFERHLDRWFMHSDAHLAWRAHSTWLQVLFEQGLLGVAAWLALGVAEVGAAVRAINAPAVSAAALAAAAGLLVVGSFDTVLDSPRIIVMLGLVGAAAFLAASASTRPGELRST
jgi:hypothetical protein